MTRARELRFVVVVVDYDVATHLFRDVFDLKVLMDLEGQGGRGVILEVPAATLEIVDADPRAHGRRARSEPIVRQARADRGAGRRLARSRNGGDRRRRGRSRPRSTPRGAIGTKASRPPTLSS